MSKKVSSTQLRNHLDRLLDEVLETGEPLEIERDGRSLMVVPITGRRRLGDLPRRQAIACSPDELVETSWEDSRVRLAPRQSR